jgi:hypothetical protein
VERRDEIGSLVVRLCALPTSWRRERGAWKLSHRHGDPTTQIRAATAVLHPLALSRRCRLTTVGVPRTADREGRDQGGGGGLATNRAGVRIDVTSERSAPPNPPVAATRVRHVPAE